MRFGAFFKKVAPWLATGAEFVPGAGPVIAAGINTIAQTHSVSLPSKTIEPTIGGISEAVAAMTGNAGALADLKKQDEAFQAQMQQIGFQNLEDMQKLADDDTANARSREIAVKDYTPEVGFYLLTTLFGIALWYIFTHTIPADNKALAYTMLGSLGTMWVTAGTYFYGTTRGSANKDQVLAGIASANGNGKH